MLEVILTGDGSPSLLHQAFGLTYHSRHGALQESRHVFIHNGLQYVANKFGPNISVFELGFGTGLNAALSAIEAQRLDRHINYIGIDKYPLTESVYGQLPFENVFSGNDLQLTKRILTAPWHLTQNISPYFNLEKIEVDILNFQHVSQYHVVYFDAFDPEAQPSLWQRTIFEKLFKALHAGGVLVTYCAKGKVKRLLRDIGFEVQTLNGPPGKREMTRAIKP